MLSSWRSMGNGNDSASDVEDSTLVAEGGRAMMPSVAANKRTERRYVAAVSFVTALVLAGVLFAKGQVSATKEQTQLVTTLDETKCSWPGQNCAQTKCCGAGGKNGYQCFAKNDDWAECMEDTCEPGVHPGEKEGDYDAGGKFVPAKWSCDKLGDRSGPDPCSAPGDDCRETKCCSSARGGNGMTCFEKDSTYATCRETCAGEDDWTCKALGNRTIFAAGCSWAGKDCSDSHLCCNRGFVCAVKDDIWTGCTQTVKHDTWVTQHIPIPAGWDGTILGGGRDEYTVAGVALDDKNTPISGTTLYCFTAYLPDSYEVDLVNEARNSKASIFACEGYDLFHSWQSAKAGWDTGEATLTNTDVFIDVWKHVVEKGEFLKYDWTVKVDADAVLLPGRLKAHIAGLRPPAYRPIYLKNNDMDPGMGNNGFLGAVEVFSKQAVQIYMDNYEGCHTTLGVQAGEDGFMKGCMDALGVGFMTDPQLFNPDKSAGACIMEKRAAFHPLKTAKDWRCCLDITNGIMHKVEYGVCDMVYPVPTDSETK